MPSARWGLSSSKSNVRNARKKIRGHSTVEFSAALFVFFIVILFPLINLMGVVISAGTICLLTHQIATRVSTQQTYGGALLAMTNECSNLSNTGFANFLKLKRSGGYQNSGCDLFVHATSVSNASTQTFGPNTPVPPPVNGAENVYEYMASTKFVVKPLIPMDGIPIVQNIPGLGQPVQLTWNADRAAEYIQGLAAAVPGGAGSTVTTLGLDAYASPPPPPPTWNGGPTPPGGWRTPTIYQMIAAAGQSIVSENIVIVLANNPNWTPTSVSISAGDKIWIDTQAVGQWCDMPGDPTLDANGYGHLGLGNPPQTVPNLIACALVAKVGSSGQPFFLGDDKYNYPPPGNGTLQMIFNDEVGMFSTNTGSQVVRIIVTK